MLTPHISAPNPKDGDHWNAAAPGAELLRQGDLDAATQVLGALVKSAPDNPYAHCFLANALFEQQAFALALPHYVRALELAPRYLGALIGSGHCLRMLQQWDAAIRVGKQALLLRPDDGDALYLLGLACHGRGDTAAARTYLERFLATKPEAEVAMEVQGLLQRL